ncbi:MAG: proton-conducting membrane transporter [Spirochaetae bacterium HGW-Spirochaetae-3]|nr:MAG: proton-conducting membrane transporter [Spirochaetae bacterium HGW-Spirochaetae-3]
MTPREYGAMAERGIATVKPSVPAISVGLGTCGIGNGADVLFDALNDAAGDRVLIKKAGCFGFCAEEPLVMLYSPGKPILLFTEAKASKAGKFVEAALDEKAYDRLAKSARAKISRWDFRTSAVEFGSGSPAIPEWNELPFFKGQEKLVLRDCGLIDPENIDEYVAIGGYSALRKALGMSPDEAIAEVTAAKLRGRGGAGFPTGLKWKMMRQNPGARKFVICNADEGDPGAYMNRNEIESDPHMLIEGMAIGAYAMGAPEGIVYARAEYPLAIERLRKAIEDATAAGFIGDNVMGTGFSFKLSLVSGAGAFVCGEETALIASLEGKAGRPSPRPPFPAQKGYLGMPTNINNVETWCNVPVVIARGAAYFTGIGTDKSPGTKVFSLVGKVKNTGLVELPLGTPLGSIVYGMGEGTGSRKRIKAVQTGGPSGGCIPAERFDVKVDYESLAELGAIMGSGGMVVMDQDNCMVDVARYFISFTSAESCGKCAPCREGLSQMLRILTDVSQGDGRMEDIVELERLARVVKDSSLCGLGQTASNPVMTTLKYFRNEYESHIVEKRCESGTCEALFEALCENSCPLHMNIPGYLALLGDGRIEDAFELTLRDNPLPGSMGRICHFHCQMRCRRDTLDEPVAQGEIHRYLADTMYKMGREKDVWNRLVKEKKPATGRTVAIVGAGPAGLAASFYLSRLGHEVTVFDSKPKAGGILRYGIPAYRLPKDVLDKELDLWKRLGVKFVFNTSIGKDVGFDSLKSQYDALIVASGAQSDRRLGVAGEDLEGVHAGYEWLEAFAMGKAPKPGRRALVLGGGNVAIDAARTLFREDCEVTVAYRRSKASMPANAVELVGAEEEGIRFEFMLQPIEMLGEKGRVKAVRFKVMKPGGIDPSGRPTPVETDRVVDIPCDDVYVAVGERVDASFMGEGRFKAAKDGRVAVDRLSGKASGNVWAIGDAVTGPATAAEAMGLGKRAAKAIDEELMQRDAFGDLFREFGHSMALPPEPTKTKMCRSRLVPPEERRGNFQEIAQGYSGEQALLEATRCLRCDIRADARSPWR